MLKKGDPDEKHKKIKRSFSTFQTPWMIVPLKGEEQMWTKSVKSTLIECHKDLQFWIPNVPLALKKKRYLQC